jgi:arabinogalactan oligomer/maltooligosaccharide transport system substrate-binding protein
MFNLHHGVRVVAGIALAASLAFVTVGPAAAHPGNAGTKPPKLQKGVTLTLWDYFCKTGQTTCPERDIEVNLIKKWEKATGDKVNFPTNPTNHDNTMCTAGPAGQGPDVIGGPHNEMGPMVACKTLAPIPAWAWPPSLQKKYIQAAVKATKINGKIYSMPWDIETTGFYYNKSLIPAKDFKPAKGDKYLRWTTLINRFKSLNLPSGGLPFGWDPANFYYDYAFISGNGGYVFKYTKKGYNWQQMGVDSKGAVKAYTFIGDLVNKYHLYQASMADSVASSLFYAGKLAVYYTGPWNEPSMQQNHINYGLAPFPSFDGKHPSRTFSGLQVYAVNAFSSHKNEAASLVSYLSQHLGAVEAGTVGRPSVIKTVLNSKKFQQNAVDKGIAKAALAGDPMPNIPEMNFVWTPMANAVTAVEQQKQTPAAALKSASDTITADITKSHNGG